MIDKAQLNEAITIHPYLKNTPMNEEAAIKHSYCHQLNPKTNKSERIRRYIPKFGDNKKKIAPSTR